MQCDPHVNSIFEYGVPQFMPPVGHYSDPFPYVEREIEVFNYYVDDSNQRILNEVANFRPTHVIWLGTCGGPYQTHRETLQEIRKTGAKTIALCPEASHPDWDRLIQEFYDAECFDLIVNLDGDPNWNDRGRGLTTLAVYGTKPYDRVNSHPWDARPIPVGFCGGSGSPGTMRERLVSHMRCVRGHNNIGLLTEFPFIENPGTYQLYADFMMMSKFIVNAAGSGEDRSKHVKGRVLEAGLAGCCLIEEEGSPIGQWFSSDCYYTFQSPEHCVELIRYLTELYPERAATAARKLSDEVRTKYSPERLWSQIFSRVG